MEEVKEIVDTVTVELANGGTQEVTDVVIQEVNHALLSAGMDEALADKVDNFVILLLIIGVALLANLICRKIILRTVAKLVKQTKATWDDIVFDHKVMVHVSRMVAPSEACPYIAPFHCKHDIPPTERH
jgi:miniconductance mechanosensitive channel